MRVLVIGRLPECEVGGLPLYTANLARAISALGHELCVVHPGMQVTCAGFETRASRAVAWPRTGRLRSFRQAFAVADEALLAAKEFAPDVLHLQYGGAMDLAILRRLARAFEPGGMPPIVVTAHCGRAWVHLERAPRLAVRQLAKAARVLVISEDQRTLFQDAGLAPERIVEVGSLVEAEFFEEPPSRSAPSPARAERAVYLGRIAPEKGLETVVSALAQLAPEERPIFTATGPISEAYRTRLERLCRDAGVQEHFHLAAPVAGVTARLAVLDGADLLLHPTHSDVKPLVVIEAMARSLPVLASSLPGTVQLCGGTATHFEPGDATALATCLRQRAAARRAGTLAAANPAGRELARAFEPEGAARETLAVFDELLSRGVPA